MSLIVHPDHSHLRRADMPQITDVAAFMAYLHGLGIHHHKRLRSPFHLKPTQNELNLDLVWKLIQDGLKTNAHPLIVARDLHILDGHSRWYAAQILRVEVVVMEVDLGLAALLGHARAWEGAGTESVDAVALA